MNDREVIHLSVLYSLSGPNLDQGPDKVLMPESTEIAQTREEELVVGNRNGINLLLGYEDAQSRLFLCSRAS
jgi:hypothetical protein